MPRPVDSILTYNAGRDPERFERYGHVARTLGDD